jgi:hypothetical protein
VDENNLGETTSAPTAKNVHILSMSVEHLFMLQCNLCHHMPSRVQEQSATQVAAVEMVVDEAVAGLDQKVLSVLFTRYRLRQHLDAIKRYLLLGQGDFIETFMGLVGSHLDQPVCLSCCLQAVARDVAGRRLPAAGVNMRRVCAGD